jgi:hypothetical protein
VLDARERRRVETLPVPRKLSNMAAHAGGLYVSSTGRKVDADWFRGRETEHVPGTG